MGDYEARGRADAGRVIRASNRKKQKKKKKIFLRVCLVLLLLLAIVYGCGYAYYTKHFLRGTAINGIDVSNMTFDRLARNIRGYELVVSERGKDSSGVYIETIRGTDIGIEILSDIGIERILNEQEKAKWFLRAGKSYEKETLIDYDEKRLERTVESLKGLNPEYSDKPVSAYISDYNTQKGYEIIPENRGNRLEKDAALKAVNDAVYHLETKLDLDAAGCYREPEIEEGNKKLNNLLNSMNRMVSARITYDFGGEREVLDGQTVSEWITVDEDKFKADLDPAKVDEFVESLRRKYDTIFTSRTFETTYGQTVTLDRGDYGWWMNCPEEEKELASQIREGKSGARTPVYYQTAAKYGEKDYGDTYVEINLTAQHLFVYKNGKLALESDCVSGLATKKRETPDGIYGITYKERYSELVGETYESTVSYWMPFNKDIGLHDAIWKTRFGDSYYKTEGSHGCINLPYLTAKKIYSLVEKGTPVICYRLPGTESASVTTQDNMEIAQAAIEAIDAIGKVTKESGEDIEDARYMYNKIGAGARQYVDNYAVLEEAEQAYKALKKDSGE